MTRPNFMPIGERARWRICYDIIVLQPVDGVVTYEQLRTALDGRASRSKIQQAMRRAARELLETHGRAVDAVPNVGYRIARAEEHLALAKRDQTRSRRALERGHDKVVYVDLNEVADPIARAHFQHAATALAGILGVIRRLDVGHKQLAERVHKFESRSERTEEEVAELRARLARLEQREDAMVSATG